MKKMTALWLILAIFVFSVLPAMAYDSNAMVTVRRSILINGEHQQYIPFAFNVPSVNCGTLEVKEYKRSYPFFGQQASWQTKFAGERVGSGWYRFSIVGADLSVCAPIIDISTEMPQLLANMVSGSFMEVEPEDLGLFVKGGVVPENFFNLSTDDYQFSYELVSMGIGTSRTLESFKKNTHFFSDTGDDKIVGAIVADSRGFLLRKVMFAEDSNNTASSMEIPRGLMKNPLVKKILNIYQQQQQQILSSDIVIREGDVVVLIRKETL